MRRWMEELLEAGRGYEEKSRVLNKKVADELYKAYGGRVSDGKSISSPPPEAQLRGI